MPPGRSTRRRSRRRSAAAPTRSDSFEVGRFIEYERVKDWWGADLPVARGQNNFDTCAMNSTATAISRFRRSRRRAICSGRNSRPGSGPRAMTFRRSTRAASNATSSRSEDRWDARLVLQYATGIFKDKRVREALIYAFDFEWTNKTLMFGSYQRMHSLFQNSDMMAVGKPGPDEMALLGPLRDKVPAEVFEDPFVPPVSDGSGQDRLQLRKASALLQDAGFAIVEGKRVTPQGEKITVEFLIDEPSTQPHHMPFIKNLGTLGIEATLRIVDPVQFRARLDDFDFDITVQRFGFSTLPGALLRTFFSSRSAASKGSQNSRWHLRPAC